MGIDLDLSSSSPRAAVAALTRLKIVRYATASAVAVPVGLGVLWVLTDTFDWGGIEANLTSVAFGSVPNYLINRYWTWQQRGRNRLWTEIVPFWVMALMGTILSTLAVAYADDRWGTPLAMSIAQLSGFGVLWFARFLVLDKLMWRVVHELHPEIDLDGAPVAGSGDGGSADGSAGVGDASGDGNGREGVADGADQADGNGAGSPGMAPTSER